MQLFHLCFLMTVSNVEEIGGIVHLMIEELKKRLEDHHIAIVLTQKAVDFIVREGFDPVYGARPLRRFIQQHIETLIARSMIGGKIMDGSEITIDSNEEELQLSWKNHEV